MTELGKKEQVKYRKIGFSENEGKSMVFFFLSFYCLEYLFRGKNAVYSYILSSDIDQAKKSGNK